jgi:hypothetical protein
MIETRQVKDVTSADIRILTQEELEAVADGAHLSWNNLEYGLFPTGVRET